MRLSLATIMILLPLAGAGCAADYGNDNVCGVSPIIPTHTGALGPWHLS